jgi:hypothetical protein
MRWGSEIGPPGLIVRSIIWRSVPLTAMLT